MLAEVIDLLTQILEQMIEDSEDRNEMKEDIATIKELLKKQSDYI